MTQETNDPRGAQAPSVGSGPTTKFCFACGATLDVRAEICPACGIRQPHVAGMAGGSGFGPGDAITRTGKSKLAASLFAIFLGGLGVHKFYLGDTTRGVVYLIFFWTLIPAIVGFIEGIVWLAQSNEVWLDRYGAA